MPPSTSHRSGLKVSGSEKLLEERNVDHRDNPTEVWGFSLVQYISDEAKHGGEKRGDLRLQERIGRR